MFEHEPRNWKWMVPAALIAPCVVWWNDWWISGGVWSQLAMIPLGLAVVLLIAFLLNLWLYGQRRWADMYSDVQTIRNATPEVRMMEAAKGMHPEAVKALLVHRRTIWRIKYIPKKETVDWILDEAPTVHAGFVDFVLDHSNGVSLMAKHGLSEGSTKFDPDGLITDYEQYDDLLLLLQQKLMVTQAFGNQSPHFLPPWNVEMLRKRFGLDGEGYEVDEEGGWQVKINDEGRMRKAEGNQQSAFSGQPGVIQNALEGLEQTQAMKLKVDKLNRNGNH